MTSDCQRRPRENLLAEVQVSAEVPEEDERTVGGDAEIHDLGLYGGFRADRERPPFGAIRARPLRHPPSILGRTKNLTSEAHLALEVTRGDHIACGIERDAASAVVTGVSQRDCPTRGQHDWRR